MRRIAARLLVALGVLLAVASALAGYARWQVLDQPTFARTAERLIDDDAIRAEIASTAVDRLFASVDVGAVLEARLPETSKPLAAPLAATVRGSADRVAAQLLERPAVQRLLLRSVIEAHARVVDLLGDDLTVIRTDGGYAVLDVRPIVVELATALGVVDAIEGRLPPEAGRIRLVSSEQLETAQDLTELFRSVATWLWVLPLALFALAVGIARDRRTELRAVAAGLVLAGLLVLVARTLVGSYLVDRLTAGEAARPAVESTWRIVTDLLRDGALSLTFLGAAALAGIWVASAPGALRLRAALAPHLRRPGRTYAAAALLLLLLVWWGPTAQARRWQWLVPVVALSVAGIEALRRAVARRT